MQHPRLEGGHRYEKKSEAQETHRLERTPNLPRKSGGWAVLQNVWSGTTCPRRKKMLTAEGSLTRDDKKDGQALPNMLPGYVCRQFVKRGSKACGPYWYRFWREAGKLRKA